MDNTNTPPFTKEKWRITDWLEITTSRKGIVEGSKQICQVSEFGKTKEEATANAHLICASLEMYEALKEIKSHISDGIIDIANANYLKANIENALAKAEGK